MEYMEEDERETLGRWRTALMRKKANEPCTYVDNAVIIRILSLLFAADEEIRFRNSLVPATLREDTGGDYLTARREEQQYNPFRKHPPAGESEPVRLGQQGRIE